MRPRGCIGGAMLALILFLFIGLSQAAEFTATTVTKTGELKIPGMVYVKGNKIRNEIQAAGQTGIHIIRPDKNLMWVILPQQKTYMEMPLTEEAHQNLLTLTENQKAKMKKIGTETVNNYACEKYETTMSHQGKATKFYVWVAPELGMPLKVVTQNGSFSSEIKDIKTGEVEASLFEPPPGYRKMKMPLSMPPMK